MNLKKFILLLAGGIGGLGTAWGQIANSPSTSQASGVNHASVRQGKGPGYIQDANLHSVSSAIRARMKQLRKDRKAGKLTSGQAKAALDGLKNIRRQELQFFRQNGTRSITENQMSSLNSMLQKWDAR